MTRSNPFLIGRGSEVTVALLPKGKRTEIPPQVLTVGGAVSAGANSVSVSGLASAIGGTAQQPFPTYLTFVDAVDESDKPVSVNAPVATGGGSLPTDAVPLAISAGSTAQYPVRLEARTSADLTTTANDTTTTVFESGGYEDGIITRIGYGLSCPGNFLASDAGFRTCFYAFQNFLEIWLSLHLPVPGGYSSGYIFKGPAAVKNAPLKIPADGIITADL